MIVGGYYSFSFSDTRVWFLAQEECRNGSMKGLKVEWLNTKRGPDVAKATSIDRLWRRDWIQVVTESMDPKVLKRFQDRA